MPLVDDPSVSAPLLVPRGFIPLPGSDEEIHPAKPPIEPKIDLKPIAPTFADKVISTVISPLSEPLLIGSPTWLGALHQSNNISSAYSRFQDTHGVSNDLADPNYSPWDEVAGTRRPGRPSCRSGGTGSSWRPRLP